MIPVIVATFLHFFEPEDDPRYLLLPGAVLFSLVGAQSLMVLEQPHPRGAGKKKKRSH